MNTGRKITRKLSAASAPTPATPSPSRSFSRTTELDSGLHVVCPGRDPVVDLIAVHGLNGHWEKTWSTPSGVNWLRDILPSDIPNARVLTYGYNSRTHGSNQLTAQSLYDHAITFVTDLCAYRRNTKTETRPILFLAHSLGGLLVKSAIIHSNLSKDHQNTIKIFTRGIVFFGTPHRGSSIASLGLLVLDIFSIFGTNTSLIRHLQQDSEWLRMQTEQFNPISSEFDIVTFYETYKTPIPNLLGRGILIVQPQSATLVGNSESPSIPLRKNHKDLVRFEDRFDSDYRIVCHRLQALVAKLDNVVVPTLPVPEIATMGGMLTSVSRSPDPPGDPSGGSDEHAPPPKSPAADMVLPFWLPVQQNPGFVGRQDHLEKLHDYFCNYDETPASPGAPKSKIAVLYGLGGTGKTQLALAYAEHYKKQFGAVAWIDASSERNTLLSFRTIAQRLLETRANEDERKYLQTKLRIGEYVSLSGHISTDDNDLPKISRCVIEFLQTEDERFTWLMVMDNLDDLKGYPLLSYLPQNRQRGNIIITSRLTAVTQFGRSTEIGQMDGESGVQILLNAASMRIKSKTDDEDAKSIANALGYLPLALEQAGAYISASQIRLTKFLQLLDRRHRDLMSSPTGSGLSGSQISVSATFELSFERLDDDAAELLTLMSFLHNSSFWEGLVHHHDDELGQRPNTQRDITDLAMLNIGVTSQATALPQVYGDEIRLEAALAKIFSVSLAKRNAPDVTVYLHPLVHSWGRERLSTEDRQRKLIQAVIIIGKALESAYTRPMTKNVQKFISRVVPHADHCINLVNKEGENVRDGIVFRTLLTDMSSARALFYLGVLFQNVSRLKEAEVIFKAIISASPEASDREPVINHIMAANTRRRLGEVMILYSRYKEGEGLLRDAIQTLKEHRGEHHEDTVIAMLELGMVYHRQHEYEIAEVHLREAIENGTNKSTGLMGRAAREASSILGLVYRHLGRLNEALDILTRALEQASLNNHDKGEDDDQSPAHLPTIQYRHAIIHQELGHWNAARETYTKVYLSLKETLGAGHPLTLRTTNALGRVYCFLGLYSESRDLLDIAYKGQEALGFSKENETAQLRTLFNIGVLNREEGLYPESLECLERVKIAYDRLFGGGSMKSKASDENSRQGVREAVDSDTVSQSTIPKFKFPVQDAMLELGITLTAIARAPPGSGSGGKAKDGRLDDAVEILETLLASQMKHDEKSLMDYCQTRVALAEAYITYRAGAFLAKAEEVLIPALDFVRENLEMENPLRLKVELTHVSLLLESGKGKLALSTIEGGDIISRLETVFGKQHQTTMRGKALLAMAYHQAEKSMEARKLIAEVFDVLKDTLGEKHPMTREVVSLAERWDPTPPDDLAVGDGDDELGKGGKFKVKVLAMGKTF